MSKPVFVYVTYIASTPDKVFKALTDTEATGKFWFGNAATSSWTTKNSAPNSPQGLSSNSSSSAIRSSLR
jgi:uncharacterized protein YndB with AHSA1/START domain